MTAARMDECLSCERVRAVRCRGLCGSCWARHKREGTLAEFGYVKTDRMCEYARLRLAGEPLQAAAQRAGVSLRTGWRYEAEMAGSGQAPWREWSHAA